VTWGFVDKVTISVDPKDRLGEKKWDSPSHAGAPPRKEKSEKSEDWREKMGEIKKWEPKRGRNYEPLPQYAAEIEKKERVFIPTW